MSAAPVVMRRSAFTLACAAAMVAQPAFGDDRGYAIWFSGRVLAIDQHRGMVRIARGPTETAGPAVEDFLLKRKALERLRPGMVVEAQADTRRRPWKILHMRIFERRATRMS